MNLIQRCTAVALIVACLLPMQCGIAELAPDRVEFYKERTEEWENALGAYALWNYYERAMFCTIYGRRPGDYLNDESIHEAIPKFPPKDCLTYEEALSIATEFLCDYDPRITEEYLSPLNIASAYYDFMGNSQTTITGKAHTQFWVIQFGEVINNEYLAHCDAYIDACAGRVVCIDIFLDMKNSDDWENHKFIQFQ